MGICVNQKHKTFAASALLGLVAFFLVGLSALVMPTATHAQERSGRGVDMRAIAEQGHSCRQPAMRLYQDVLVLRQGIRDILECNAQGEFFIGGACVPAVTLDHDFRSDYTGNPDNRDGLAFEENGNFNDFGLIGGADGADIRCALENTCTDPCTNAELEEGEETSVIYKDTRACGEDCQSTTLTCGADGLSDLPAGWSGSVCGECPDENCDSCTDPCTGATVEDGQQTDFVYEEIVACGETCTSTFLTCTNGSLSSPPWGGEGDFVCGPCPDCLTCPADTLEWTTPEGTCEGPVSLTNIGQSDTAQDTIDPLTGSATFPCEADGEWGAPTSATCTPTYCNNPCGAGTISDGTPVTVYENRTLSCGETAADAQVTLTCTDGDTGFNESAYQCNAPDAPGVWELEDDWSTCSATCGGGTQTKEYICSCGAGNCSGSQPSDKSQACNEGDCEPTCVPIDWEFDGWEPHPDCDISTGMHTMCGQFNRQEQVCGDKVYPECYITNTNILIDSCSYCRWTADKCTTP